MGRRQPGRLLLVVDAPDPNLSEREAAALAVLVAFGTPMGGNSLAGRMCNAGRSTRPAAAHQAGAALARKGLATKGNYPFPDSAMKYEATNAGREWIARHQATAIRETEGETSE